MSLTQDELGGCGAAEERDQINGHTDKLTDDLMDWLDSVDDNNFDEEKLDSLLAQLREVAPQPAFDVEASLSSLHDRYQPMFERKSKPKAAKKRHKLLPLVAVLILALSITAQAEFNLFTFVANWTKEIFGFEEVAKPATIGAYPIGVGEKAEYASLEDAFEAFEIEGPLIPTWLPDGFEVQEVVASVVEKGVSINAVFTFDKKIIIALYREKEEFSFYDIEKDISDVETMKRKGNEHYVTQDKGFQKAIWMNGQFECVISGNISREDVKKIIDSIYEE